MGEAAPAPTPGPVTAADRLIALDVVRGLAVLGILVMNVVEFGQPLRAYANPAGGGGDTGADLWAWFAQATLFDGKMRALFSMLFGAGIVLISRRMEAAGRGGESADLLLRRCLWLVPFGIAHRFLLQWTGDILYMYGLLGLIAIAFRNARARTQIVLGLLCLSAFLPIEAWHYHQASGLRAQAAEAVALAEAGEEVPTELAQARTRWERRLAPPSPEAVQPEIAAMRSGWPTVFAYRWAYHHGFQADYLYAYFVWDVLGMMLLGMGLLQLGFFAGTLPARVYWAVIAAGVAAAALCWWQARAWHATGFSSGALELRSLQNASYAYTRGIVGLAWAAGLLLILRAGRLRGFTAALGAVGRMAFSNYVLQTVLCTLLFFGYGLGQYARFSRAELMLVWLGVTLVQIAFSVLWLRRFRFGPLEWAWRALTYGRRPPLRLAPRI
jgi:uncharacterized protein